MRKWFDNPDCDECGAILQALRDAHELDQQELRKQFLDTAESSGRGIAEMGVAWVSSIAQMPNDEMSTIMRLHRPRTTEVRRKLAEHEAETGHSVYGYGWESIYGLHGHLAAGESSDLLSSLLLLGPFGRWRG